MKVIQDAELDTMRDPSFCSSLEVLKTPTFWRYSSSSLPWRANGTPRGGVDQSPDQPTVEAMVRQSTLENLAGNPDGTPILQRKKKRVARQRIRTTHEPARPLRSKLASQRVLVSHKQFARILTRSRQTPAFCAIVKPKDDEAGTHDEQKGMTALQKRKIMREQGPKHKEDFKTVEDQRETVLNELPVEQQTKLREILEKYHTVFPDALPKGAPPARLVEHEIKLVDNAVPRAKPPYRLGQKEQDELEKQIRDLLD